MSTPSQIAANQANAQLSTGPQTESGKAASSKNNFRHGMTGRFLLTPDDDYAEFLALAEALRTEHNPETPAETILVERMTEAFWMTRKAMKYQAAALDDHDDVRLALMLRYQTTHDKAFHKCLDQLAKLRAERRKDQIGFESQKRQEAEETRKQEAHEAKVRNLNARSEAAEIETEVRTCMEAPMPGNVRIPFADLKTAFTTAVRALQSEKAAA